MQILLKTKSRLIDRLMQMLHKQPELKDLATSARDRLRNILSDKKTYDRLVYEVYEPKRHKRTFNFTKHWRATASASKGDVRIAVVGTAKRVPEKDEDGQSKGGKTFFYSGVVELGQKERRVTPQALSRQLEKQIGKKATTLDGYTGGSYSASDFGKARMPPRPVFNPAVIVTMNFLAKKKLPLQIQKFFAEYKQTVSFKDSFK